MHVFAPPSDRSILSTYHVDELEAREAMQAPAFIEICEQIANGTRVSTRRTTVADRVLKVFDARFSDWLSGERGFGRSPNIHPRDMNAAQWEECELRHEDDGREASWRRMFRMVACSAAGVHEPIARSSPSGLPLFYDRAVIRALRDFVWEVACFMVVSHRVFSSRLVA